MKLVKIPFNAWSKQGLKADKKRCTARSKIYGQVGDFFRVGGQAYILIHVTRKKVPIKSLIIDNYQEEGADSPEELEKVIRKIFRGKLPDGLYLHFFKRFPDQDDPTG